MYRYDNYTDSFVRMDGEPNTGSTTVRIGVPLKETAIVEKVELTDECINKIADAVMQKMIVEQTENSSEKPNNCEDEPTISKMEQVEPQTDNGIGCSRCEGRFDCCDRDMPHAVHCNNYGKITDEPQTDCAWK